MAKDPQAYGLIGYPLGHSFSPLLHSKLGDYTYDLIPLEPSEFDTYIENKDFAGLNVTIPYKEKVIPHLDYLDPLAQEIQAVNTLVNRDGHLRGYNTDFAGFAYLLDRHDISLKDKRVVILGSGGAAKMVATYCRHQASRSSDYLSLWPDEMKLSPEILKAQVIVNATPVGMYPNNLDQALDLTNFSELEAVVDLVYNPLRTALVMQAQELSIKAVGGLDMLAAQGYYASRLFMGQEQEEADNNFIEKLCQTFSQDQENWVLIGMPGVGKSTVGYEIARLMNRPFIDTDTLIEERLRQSIELYIQEQGIEAFRQIEGQVVQEVGAQKGCVIATGGGSILDPVNRLALRQNGRIIWLQRPLEDLASDGRPLSSSPQAIQTMWQERQPIYQDLADLHVEVDSDVDVTCQQVLKGIKIHEN